MWQSDRNTFGKEYVVRQNSRRRVIVGSQVSGISLVHCDLVNIAKILRLLFCLLMYKNAWSRSSCYQLLLVVVLKESVEYCNVIDRFHRLEAIKTLAGFTSNGLGSPEKCSQMPISLESVVSLFLIFSQLKCPIHTADADATQLSR